MSRLPRFLMTGTIMAILGGLAALSAQAARPTEPLAVNELLAEVRGLRAEINQAAGSSLRMQLLIARLQLQEQRTFTVAKQLTDVQERLTTARREVTQKATHINQMEEVEKRVTDAGELRGIRDMIPILKVEIGPYQQREQDLRAQEIDLQNLLTAEQARWADFSDRLDALEQSLSTGSAR